MPSLSLYRSMLKDTRGQQRIDVSKAVTEATWLEDPSSKVAYFYDWYHDTNKTVLRNLDSKNDPNKVPVDIKYIINSTQTFDKDQVTYHIMFKPSYKCNVDYYDEFFGKRYSSIFPCGLYIDIPDTDGQYNRWMVVETANFYDPMYPTFEVLPCDKIVQYVWHDRKYNVAGILRSQSSYNSGVWRDHKFEVPENQQKFIVPLNRYTEQIFYNQRMIMDAGVLTEPLTWRITKIDRLAPIGLIRGTLSQDQYDPHTDYIEVDDDGDVIGMWADYYSSTSDITPLPDIEYDTITYSGSRPQIKVGGSYKKFVSSSQHEWNFSVDGEDVSEYLTLLYVEDDPCTVKVKWIGPNTYIGKILNIKCGNATLDVEIISL